MITMDNDLLEKRLEMVRELSDKRDEVQRPHLSLVRYNDIERQPGGAPGRPLLGVGR